MIIQAGILQRLETVRIVALYERDSGVIKHIHTVVNFEAGHSVSEEQAIEAARRQASNLGRSVDKLATAVSTNLEHAIRPHRIDVATGDFVPIQSEVLVQEPLERRDPSAS